MQLKGRWWTAGLINFNHAYLEFYSFKFEKNFQVVTWLIIKLTLQAA